MPSISDIDLTVRDISNLTSTDALTAFLDRFDLFRFRYLPVLSFI